MISDQELATRVAGFNDQAAFGTLVGRHQAAIRRFLRRLLTGDHSSADDLAQDTFLIAYRKIHTWRSNGSFVSWLHTIAYRQFLQFSRKRSQCTGLSDLAEPGIDSGQAVEAEILTQNLLGMVSTEDRACLTLAYAAGMSHAEICRITSLPLGTVKSRIQRGRQKLQQWLEKNDHSIQKTGPNPEKEALSAG